MEIPLKFAVYAVTKFISGVGLKCYINKRKERDKDFEKRQSSVINYPPQENDTVGMKRESIWSENGKIISSSTIDSLIIIRSCFGVKIFSIAIRSVRPMIY